MIKKILLACRYLFLFPLFIASAGYGQPKINALSPASGAVGSSVTITGTGFDAGAGNNIVYFGAVAAVVTSASVTSLTVTVPAGATFKPVSVLNKTSGLTAYSSQPFMITFANPFGIGIPGNFYQSPVGTNTSSGGDRKSVVADIDGDGRPDVVIPNPGANTISVYRNISTPGSGTALFAPKADIATAVNPTAVTAGDLDGDGRMDLVVANTSATSVSVFRNHSGIGDITTSSFDNRIDYPAELAPYAVTICDLDGDGKPDITAAVREPFGYFTTVGLVVLRNTAVPGSITSSSFAPKVDIHTGVTPAAVTFGDLDGDARPDIVLYSPRSGSVSAGRNVSTPGNISDASFTNYATITLSNNITAVIADVAIGDLDGDGKPDLAVADNSSGSVSIDIIRNTSVAGAGTALSFTPKFNLITGYTATSVVIADVDGDGKSDVVEGVSTTGDLYVFRNITTAGSFTAESFPRPVNFQTNSVSTSIAIGDVTGDGLPDVITTGSFVWSLLKLAPPATTVIPVINSVSPDSSRVSTSVTINGAGFNPVPASNIVYFGAVRATVTAGSSASLTTTVPAGASYSPVSVLDTATRLTGYAAKPYVTTFTNPFGKELPGNYYLPVIGLSPYYSAYDLAIGDLDGDGKPEVVTTNLNDRTVSVLRNNTVPGSITGNSFAAAITFPVELNPLSPVIGDLDGDGKPEIVIVNTTSGSISILHNITTPGIPVNASSFTVIRLPTGSTPGNVCIHDLDGDGKPELIASNSAGHYVAVFPNIYSGGNFTASSFGTQISLPLSSAAGNAAVSDIDGDGKPDIVVTTNNPGRLVAFRNTSLRGSLTIYAFSNGIDIASIQASQLPYSNALATADMDGDGKEDLLLRTGGRTLTLLRNTAIPGEINSSSFAPGFDVSKTGSVTTSFTAGDVDGDGKPDIVCGNSLNDELSILLNNSTPGNINASSFIKQTDFAVGTIAFATGITLGDLDGDGVPEVVTAETGPVHVFKQALPGNMFFSPASGFVNTQVTITGSFNATPANNIVYFGAVKATVTAGTTSTLTVNAPAGATYQPLSVSNTATGLTAYSSKPFVLIFTPPSGSAITANFYRPKVDYATGTGPRFVATGDLDGDGKPDLITANFTSNTISVLRNTSATGSINVSSFGTGINFETGINPFAVLAGDVDGDGKQDLVVANYGSSTISVLRNTSVPGSINATSFAAKVDFVAGNFTYPFSIAMGDIDGDGRPDLLAANSLSNTVSVFRNTSTPGTVSTASFAAKVDFSTGDFPRYIAVSDIDGDGKVDVITANERANTVSVLRNIASPGFIHTASLAPKADFATGTNPVCVATGDVDGDGRTDLLVANYTASSVSVIRNTSVSGTINATSFAAKTDFATSPQPYFTTLADVNGDGKPDIISANSFSSNLTVWRNAATGGGITALSFDTRTNFAAGGYPVCIAAGDMDGDGIAELITANTAENSLSVFKTGQSQALTAGTEAAAGITVYPNPVDRMLVLQIPEAGSGVVNINVLNENGRVIDKQVVNAVEKTASLQVRIDMSRHVPGVYYIKVTSTKGMQIAKVVLQR